MNDNVKVILCIDGGSIRNYVSLQLLNKIKEIIEIDLSEICDLITSTSSGSIIVCSKSNKSNKIISNDKLIKQYKSMTRKEHTIRFSSNSIACPNSSIFNTQSNLNILLHNSVNSTTAFKNSIIHFFNNNEIQLAINSNNNSNNNNYNNNQNPSSSPSKIYYSSPSSSPSKLFNTSSYHYLEPTKKGLVVCVCENKVTKERIAKVYTNYENQNRIQIKGKTLDIQRTNLPIECVFEQFQDSKNVYYDSGTIYNSSIYFAYNEAKSLFPNNKLLIISIGSGYDIKSSKGYQISNNETNNKVNNYINSRVTNNNSRSNNNNNSNGNNNINNRDFRNLYKKYETFINKENSFSLINDFNEIQKEEDCFIYRFDCPINFETQDSFNFASSSSVFDGASSPSLNENETFSELKDCVERSIDQQFNNSLFTIRNLLNLNN